MYAERDPAGVDGLCPGLAAVLQAQARGSDDACGVLETPALKISLTRGRLMLSDGLFCDLVDLQC